ncbi:hypothetical protein WR25_18343, partial [Diploscapter pachys]
MKAESGESRCQFVYHIDNKTGSRPNSAASATVDLSRPLSVASLTKLEHECQWKKHTGCEERFATRKKLVAHMRKEHVKKNPFKCTHCDYKATTSSNLEVHMRKHTGEPINVEKKKRQEKRRSNLLRRFNLSFDNQRLIKLIKRICKKKDEAVYQNSKLKLFDEEDKALSGAVYALFEAEEGFDPSKASAKGNTHQSALHRRNGKRY